MDNKYFPLTNLKQGDNGKIVQLEVNDSLKKRLMDIGFVNGVDVSCVLVSPLGDPKAYWIKGCLIALRKEDSDKILIKDSLWD